MLGVLMMLLAWQAPDLKRPRPAPEQPIPYSHKLHAGTLKLACKQCHEMAEPGESAGFPATVVCMACHKEIRKDSDAIKTLAGFHAEGKPVPWARVYRIQDYVFFSHKEHVAKGASCEGCHGAVAEREAMRREKDLSMAGCMECHRAKEASLACNYCHDPR